MYVFYVCTLKYVFCNSKRLTRSKASKLTSARNRKLYNEHTGVHYCANYKEGGAAAQWLEHWNFTR